MHQHRRTRDLFIIGVDDIPLSRLVFPALTAIALDLSLAAARNPAAQMLA